MNEEVIPCDYSECDVYILKPGKTQCSHEGTPYCGAHHSLKIDKTKVAKMDMEAFRQSKELEDDIKLYKKIIADWKETAEALAISLGDVEIAQDVYEDISSGLYEVVRERMIPNTNPQKSFEGIHDYAILICTKSGKAEELRIAAEDAGTSDYYYWDGYIAALDYAMDILPNYNS